LSNEKFRVPLSRVNITEEPLDVDDHGSGGGRRVAPNSVTYALVVKGCADAGRPAVARDVFNEMLECGITPPAQAVVSLLAAYASAGEFSSSVTLLKRLKEWGIVPNIRMMSSVMHACLNAGQPNAALTVFSKVKSSSSKPDVVLYTLLVKAYGMKGEFEKAFNVLKTMLREGSHCTPNVVTYNTLISCAVSHGRTDLALRALQCALDRPGRSRINNATFDALVNVSFRDDAGKVSSATDALLAVEDFDEFVVEAVGGTREVDVKLKQIPAGDKAADGQSVGAPAIQKYSPLYLSYLMDAVYIVRQAGAFPNGQIYVALLETCELCEEWSIGMRLISERAKGGFVVGRASISEARFFEEIFRSRAQR
jgi:pentatricopeptide repeat protein